MPMTRCDSGHFYNPESTPHCPYCRKVGDDVGDTVGLGRAAPAVDLGETRGIFHSEGGGESARPRKALAAGSTVGVHAYRQKAQGKEATAAPVVGWLVCVAGANLGEDYRLVQGRNAIGRNPGNEVVVDRDPLISGDAHAEVFYDYRNDKALIYNKNGRNGTYVNNQPVLGAAQALADRDCIELGDTRLMFVALCGDGFRWD